MTAPPWSSGSWGLKGELYGHDGGGGPQYRCFPFLFALCGFLLAFTWFVTPRLDESVPESVRMTPAQNSCFCWSPCLEPEEDSVWWNVSRLQLRVEEIFLSVQRAEL